LVFDDPLWVVTVKLALVCPDCTVMLDGTLATDVLLLDSATEIPPAGAPALRVTVPVELFPPLTLVGFRLSAESVTPPDDPAVMVRDAC
jgi:hypothetical protein